ncbi:hypothetical protein U0070_018105 [Myodes glareolus]|uniref:Uncharacterized protein n=1 Tax=Myodes glareolus TaxID=447135 RepID=A0AAW0HLD0_MYOGA
MTSEPQEKPGAGVRPKKGWYLLEAGTTSRSQVCALNSGSCTHPSHSYGFLSHRSQEFGDSETVSRKTHAQPNVLTPRYVVFLKLFLETAEQHFMVGHKVVYYVFTDRPAEVPQVPLGAGRKLAVLTVRNYSRWQDVSMHRMEMISHFSERRFLHEVDYLVCADVDMKFRDHVGVEILSALFGTLHPGFYRSSREAFTYERRPKSRAYIPRDEGDFYYMGAFFGGSVVEVHHLTKACHQAMVEDQANGIEAVWHDESHLNKYLLSHKPTKVLSPEYMWDQQLLGWPSVMRKLRYVAVPKNHQAIRNR